MVVFIVYFILWIAIGFEFGYGFKLYSDYRQNRVKYTAIPTIAEEEEEKEEKWDIVYVLKNDIDDGDYSELRYSLRSLINFPHRNVWFAGGQPERLKPDCSLPINQTGRTIWDKVRNTVEEVCKNENISENFWLFNDDFFIMHPIKEFKNYSNGDLAFMILALEDKEGKRVAYSDFLRDILILLKREGLPTKSFENHTPLLVNKQLMLEVLTKYPKANGIRSLYGNYAHLKTEEIVDVKYFDYHQQIDENLKMISSLDREFKNGAVGRYVRKSFPEKSKYEID